MKKIPSTNNFSAITPEIEKLAQICVDNSSIDPRWYVEYKVNRGLRDLNGNGVLTGLTEVSEIQASEMVDGVKQSRPGQLFYRGIAIEDLVDGFISEKRFGFEETTYLLLFGSLPTREQLDEFKAILAGYRSLPTGFVRDIIMKAPSFDMMNTLARSVLTMYSYDSRADDTSLPNVVRQCLQFISIFPLLAVYGFQAYEHYYNDKSLFIHPPLAELSTAENILYMLRPDSKYTELEARILDLCLVLHAEHGGGNNSTFTTHVVGSSGTDAYSVIAAALGSLKGPKHGGANIKVVRMFEDIKENIRDWHDDEEIAAYLRRILSKDAFDRSGLIYGMGHAIYSVSDPRAQVLKGFVESLSAEKGLLEEYKLYSSVERLAPSVIGEARRTYKGVSANVDFYSGFVYDMLGLPTELFTPIFAIARIAGWSAHLMEENINAGKIIRPAYMNVQPRRAYTKLDDRT
ncbi:MAG: citrate/2-methylcitrate synthase [Ruminococcaceae bacterium]|nr:citrate/2-methylcitrate synthase [Oscillospiraceae bacterium]